MKLMRVFAAAAVAICTMAGAVAAQDFPTKQIRLVVVFTPGGTIDFLGRLLASEMEKSLGQPVIVENIGGAGGIVGTEVVAGSEPDGYTLALVSPGSITVAAAGDDPLSYDPRALTPIANLASYVPVLLARADLPVETVEDLIAYSDANPDELSYGASGVGSSSHLMGELFRVAAGLDVVGVQFKGGGEVMQGLLTGDIDLSITSYASAEAQIEAGQVKVLAVFDTDRYHTLPDVPAMTEALPDFQPPIIWFGVFGPPGMPTEIAERLNAEFNKALALPDVQQKLDELAYEVIGGSPADFATFLVTDFEQMQVAVDAAGTATN